MDRRVMVGLVGIALAGSSETCPAQVGPGRDPTGQPSVGMGPIPSIGDSINNTTLRAASAPGSSTVPMAPSAVPVSPVGRGPDAVIPTAPVPSDPVSLTPLDPIDRSIGRGFGTGAVSSMFRKPGVGPSGGSVAAPAPASRPRPRTEPAVKAPPWASPSPRPRLASAVDPNPAAPAGRPSPYAGQLPELPRPQADAPASPVDDPGASLGRPSPYAQDRPPTARPRAEALDDRPQRPRPRTPATIPAPVPIPADPIAPGPAAPAPPDLGPPDVPPTAPVELPAPPALEPVPAQAQAPIPTAAATPPPMGTDPLAGMPLVVAPAPAPAPVRAPAPVAAVAIEAAPVDPSVSRTGRDEDALRIGPAARPRELPYATIRAAAVGDEIITINELSTAVNDQLKDFLASQPGPMSDADLFQLKNQVAASVLNRLIDQSLILQEAKRKMANPKSKQMFDEFVDKMWKADEVPPLLRKTASANVHELKIKLAAEGKSYDAMKEAFRKKVMAHEFLGAEIRNKITSDLVDLKVYYSEHLDQFEQPARMTWREVEVRIGKYPDRAAARRKADEALNRLLRDEDFAAVARSTSDGPTASKGGLYVDMQPGSYGIPAVNDELNRIPVGQVSQVLEAPGSFHIVRVDSRREKGPLRFDEVQDRIRSIVIGQNAEKAVEAYLTKLRGKTLIRTMFDNTASDPALARRADAAVRPASIR